MKNLFRTFLVGLAVTVVLPLGGCAEFQKGLEAYDRGDYADIQKGLDAYQRGDFATALRELEPLAKQGDAKAQYGLGFMYSQGQGVPKDYKKAAKWYKLSAEQGYADAQNSLGVMYQNGSGVSQDYKTAVKWYRLAADQGVAQAQSNLGNMYDQGQGVPQDYAEAARWYRLAAERGNALAQYNLGVMYQNGQGVSQNDKEAVKWFRLAAEQGDAHTQYILGAMYRDGRDVSQNDKEAVKWFRLAAEQGDAWGMHSLGVMYSDGRGVQKDDKEGVKWTRLAAEQGFDYSQYDLGFSYEFGRGVPQDEAESAKWYHRAAEQGFDHARAIKWFREIAEEGDSGGQYSLGKFYEIGRVVSRDYTEALKWYRLSANQGYPDATKALAKLEGQETQTAESPSAQTKDTIPPSIDIPTAITVKTDSPTVRGRVTDNERIAQVTVEGRAANLNPDGTFTFTRYVPSTGTTVEIIAIDEWGNKSSQIVKLVRTITDTSEQVTFASLDPTKIKGQINNNAVALVIGVADYTRAPDAVYADSDASVFGDYAHRALGIPRSNIKVLTNSDAALTDLKIGVKQWLRGRIEEGKTDVYVFYAGHGLASPDGEDLYLLPFDGVPSLLEDTSLQRNELFEVIANANPKSATVFLDTCYSGLSRGEETLLASARPILISPKQQSTPKGFTVFSAASGQQISSGLDEAKHGLFSYYLMKGMEGPADRNGDRAITAGELHAYVLKNVKQQAVRLGREQIPELQGDAERVLVKW